MALDADTGRVIWEYKFNIFQSDVPPHRVGWASPAADPETGNIYAFSGGAQAIALDRDGKLLWDRSFGEEWAAFTTHGGRTMSPVVDGDLVIVSAPVSNWGTSANRSHRLIALDKRTGETVYVSNPGGRPYDTAYASPLIATINGMRLLIAGLGDGAIHAIKPQTGEKVWSFVASKRAINTGVAVKNNLVLVSHGDENIEGNTLGLIAAIDGSQTGDIKTTKWAKQGTEFAFSPPVVDGTRLYQIDGGSTLNAFDIETGKELWSQPLGTAQKAPPVLADGKIYVGNDNGKFFIIRPRVDQGGDSEHGAAADQHEQLLQRRRRARTDSRRRGDLARPDLLRVERRRLCDRRAARDHADRACGRRAGGARHRARRPHVQVTPTELVLTPGQTVKLRARLFDAQGTLSARRTGDLVARRVEGHGRRTDRSRSPAIRSNRPA